MEAAIGSTAGLLDDVRFAKAWVAGRLAVRPSGAVRLRRELQQKGVLRDIVEEALRAGLSEADERAQALALAQARRRQTRVATSDKVSTSQPQTGDTGPQGSGVKQKIAS